jgi:hypothetical protein
MMDVSRTPLVLRMIIIQLQRELLVLCRCRQVMRCRFAISTLILLALVPLSGCISNDVETIRIKEPETMVEHSLELQASILQSTTESPVIIGGQIGGWEIGDEVIMNLFSQHENIIDAEPEGSLFSVSDEGIFQLFIEISTPGIWAIDFELTFTNGETLRYDGIIVEILAPIELPPNLLLSAIYELDEISEFTLRGSIEHEAMETCSISAQFFGQNYTGILNEMTGSFAIELGVVSESGSGLVQATCGKWSELSVNRSLILLFSSGINDMDGDGIDDEFDSCPEGWGEEDGWSSSPETDLDGDGCHDSWEDLDDDNDGIADGIDNCPRQFGWISSLEIDYDQDGCRDSDEDDDDDNDGIIDILDLCPIGETSWVSRFSSDWDSDGCRDADEDQDDDNDGLNDTGDSCQAGAIAWLRDSSSDWDQDGCRDNDEDEDDDNDGVADFNETGYQLDLCPFTGLNRTDVDEFGCAGNQRDSDNDGILDDEDQCQGTPEGVAVSSVGCADLDGDGVFSNIDQCPDTPTKWTVNQLGCTVNQLPVSWNSGPYGSGRMDIVSTFSFPTLAGTTWNFQNEWTGNDTYLFLFKYTDGSGNTNSGTWAYNPATIIRALPDNVHLFYGSFDSSYHSDVVNRKADVESKLTSSEEEKWMPRIHFIDQQGGSINGGLGSLIQNWGTFYYGIDRFQQSRETGSLHDWSQGSSCCTNPSQFANEPHSWNSEYTYRIRTTDPGITTVPIFSEQWHSGGWSGGYSSYSNATFPDAVTMSGFDTMEVYAYHSCEDNRNRYSEGGCHEWDYLHYLKICDADNSSICGTEFVRYITTYGREGQWLTDITPYLWMIQDGGERRFKFEGANKMGMEMTVLLSNWAQDDAPFAAEYAFSGGQFKGEYNNQSQHKRQHLFTPPNGADRVEIVATITGHGFSSDAANCSEFCNHEHHYSMNGHSVMEHHPTVGQSKGCQNMVDEGVVANQMGSWPYGRAGWCAGQDVKQWRYDISNWVSFGTENNLSYRGLFQGQEYVPQQDTGGNRNIIVATWLVYYNSTGSAIGSSSMEGPSIPDPLMEECTPFNMRDACLQHIVGTPQQGMMTSLLL